MSATARQQHLSIAVIGAGITGLGTAWRLMRAGHAITVFEASGRVGGAIRTHREGDYLVEEGPNTIQLSTRENEQWLREVGLAREIVDADSRAANRYIVRGGRPLPVPASPAAFLRTPLFSAAAKIRLLRELFARRALADADETLAQFVRRRLGPELLDYAIDPFVGGVYAGDPHALSVRYGFPKLHRLEQRHRSLILGSIALRRERRKAGTLYKTRLISFRGGLEALPRKLAHDLGASVLLNRPVEAITRANNRWQIAGGEFDAVILALPARALASLEVNGTTPFSAFGDIEHPPVTSIALAFARDEVVHPLDGFGALVPSKEPYRILGTLFSSSLFPGRAPHGQVLLTTFVGGTRAPNLALLDDDALLALVRRDLEQLFGARGRPLFVHRRTWRHAIPQYKVGHGRFIEAARAAERRFPGLHIGGNAIDGISLAYCIESGRRLAEAAQTPPPRP